MERNYYLHKNKKTGEIVYFEYEKIKGYPITPKTKIEDAIEVSKIMFVNHSLKEKLLKKKVEIKIRYLLKLLEIMDTEGADEGTIKQSIIEAEKLRVNILNRYIKYFGNTFGSYSIKKINIILNQLKIRLYNLNMQKRIMSMYNNDLYYLDEDEPLKGRGR